MKLLFNQLKQFIPALTATPQQVADALTLTGIMVEKLEEIDYMGKKDFLLSLEVRQNRPDCLGVVGIAREVASYFGKKVVLPKGTIKYPSKKLSVKVTAKEDVKRVVVTRLEGLKNGASPEWLRQYVEFYGINSIDLLVDLSNYGMLVTGFPNHLFDADKVAGTISWERSPKDQELTTLDGTILELKKNDHLVISDSIGPLVLASAVGGKRSAVSGDTQNVLLEVAVYNASKLLRDARSLNVSTEAGNRLQKDLAAEPARFALDFLVSLFVEFAEAAPATNVFDYYPTPAKQKPIIVNSDLPSIYSGIPISPQQSVGKLKWLGFAASVSGSNIRAIPPAHRTDIEDAADVIEEIIRMVGFNAIPIDQAPHFPLVSDVTPKRIIVADHARSILASGGLDEIYSLPLTTSEENTSVHYEEGNEVRTQNSINEELPVLRESLATGLLAQQKTYLLKNVEHIGIFEIGKVYASLGKSFSEREKLAGLMQVPIQPLVRAKDLVERVLRTIGISNIVFEKRTTLIPTAANRHACYTIVVGKIAVGIVYKLQVRKLSGNSTIPNTAFFEVDIDSLVPILEKVRSKSASELMEKLVVLDANIVRPEETNIQTELKKIQEHYERFLWSLEVIDEYKTGTVIRYTVRASFVHLSDEKAKALHNKIFA